MIGNTTEYLANAGTRMMNPSFQIVQDASAVSTGSTHSTRIVRAVVSKACVSPTGCLNDDHAFVHTPSPRLRHLPRWTAVSSALKMKPLWPKEIDSEMRTPPLSSRRDASGRLNQPSAQRNKRRLMPTVGGKLPD